MGGEDDGRLQQEWRRKVSAQIWRRVYQLRVWQPYERFRSHVAPGACLFGICTSTCIRQHICTCACTRLCIRTCTCGNREFCHASRLTRVWLYRKCCVRFQMSPFEFSIRMSAKSFVHARCSTLHFFASVNHIPLSTRVCL